MHACYNSKTAELIVVPGEQIMSADEDSAREAFEEQFDQIVNGDQVVQDYGRFF
jgi:hypothetical protein